MKKAYLSRAALTFCVMILLPLAAAPWSGQNASHQVTISIVSDDSPGLAATHGLNKLVAALKARGVAVAQAHSLEAARGETLIVAGRANASGPALRRSNEPLLASACSAPWSYAVNRGEITSEGFSPTSQHQNSHLAQSSAAFHG
jgi:hypothetical protein